MRTNYISEVSYILILFPRHSQLETKMFFVWSVQLKLFLFYYIYVGAINNKGLERNPKRAKEVTLKELRKKARARARERTIKKMWTKIETSHKSANFFGKKDISEMEQHFFKNKLQANKEIIEGSGVTKIKIMPSLILGFNPNPYAPIESGTYYGGSSLSQGIVLEFKLYILNIFFLTLIDVI